MVQVERKDSGENEKKTSRGGKRKKTCAKKKTRGMMKRLEKSIVIAQLIKALDIYKHRALVKCHKITGKVKYHQGRSEE